MNEEESSGPSIEERAKAMGWSPRENFRGDPERFIEAEDFVKRGEEFVPFLKAAKKDLEKEVTDLKGQLQSVQNDVKAGMETIEELTKYNREMAQAEARKLEAQLRAELKLARREGDDDKVEKLEEDLETAREKVKETSAEPPQNTRTVNGEHPDVTAWKAENQWYGKDIERTAIANAMAQALRAEGDKTIGKEFMSKVSARMAKFTLDSGDEARTRPSKVGEGARPPGGNGSQKTFASLPPEAKAACERAALKVVGENRAYKTMKDWQAKYTKDYYEQEA